MADRSTTTTERDSKKTKEPKAKLPVGHPGSSYTSPDLNYEDKADEGGPIPPEEEEWHKRRDEQHEKEVEEAEEAEDKNAKEEKERREAEAEERRKWDLEHAWPPVYPGPQGISKSSDPKPGTATTKASSSSS